MSALRGLFAGAAAGVLLSGCAATGGRRPAFDLSEPEWNRSVRALGLDPAGVVSPFTATAEMRREAQRLAGPGLDRERLDRLHAALLDRRDFAFDYDKVGTFTAREAFEARRGNCVSFANLFIAFARSLGIPMQAGLRLPRGASEQQGDLVLAYSHLVAVHRRGGDATYDFYQTNARLAAGGEIRLLDDLEVAAVALSNRGVAALQEGDLAVARDLLEKAVRLAPTLPDLHGNLGIVLWRQGDVPAALACFHRGLGLDPHRAALLHSLAALHVARGRPAEARAALVAANVDQASPYLLVVRGDLEYAGGDLKKALRSYKRAHAKDPTLVAPLLRISRTERALGRPGASRRALEKARALSPDAEDVKELLSVPSP